MFILDSIQAILQKFSDSISALSENELNRIPQGFNNNIVWNYGHAVISSYLLLYVRTAVYPNYFVPFTEKYKIGSRPEGNVLFEEINELRSLAEKFASTVNQDFENGVFNTITPFSTSTYGTINHLATDVLTTIFAHINLHYGTAMAQKRIIQFKND